MVEHKLKRSSSELHEVDADHKRKQIVVGGALIAAAAAAFALGRHVLRTRQLKEMETFVLKADNGTEAHIRPLGCCIQRTHLHLCLACRTHKLQHVKRSPVLMYRATGAWHRWQHSGRSPWL